MYLEVHVLAGSSRSPKQVVRDVESAVMARLGVAIDHKKISVAQVEDGAVRYDHSRLKFSDVSIAFNGSRTEATVRLTKDAIVFSGLGQRHQFPNCADEAHRERDSARHRRVRASADARSVWRTSTRSRWAARGSRLCW